MTGFKRNAAFDTPQFLQQKWQRTPVFLPGFLPDFVDPLTAEELAGLACEKAVESRLVTSKDNSQWQLEHGPFPEQRFRKLPELDWTLLVQAVDLWDSGVASLKTQFDFIPSWRIDDVMVSYATPAGGVGPHFDYYDVFLLQGSGQRTWQVGQLCDSKTRIRNQSGLALLDSFEATAEYVLNPGDVLYLPPGYAHWGLASTAGLCYSIGFRDPSLAEMLEGFGDYLIAATDSDCRFRDSPPAIPAYAGEIDPLSLQNAFELVSKAFTKPASFACWFGCLVTRPKYPEFIQPMARPLQQAELGALLENDRVIRRNAGSRFAFLDSTDAGEVLLFADGEVFSLSHQLLDIVVEICSTSPLNNWSFPIEKMSTEGQRLLLELINQGSLVTEDAT